MPIKKFQILAINPGSTSTKIAFYENEECIVSENLQHSAEELQPFVRKPMPAQLDFRLKKIKSFCDQNQIDLNECTAIVGRGGLLQPLKSGTYQVNARMLADLHAAKRGEHASNLGAMLAGKLVHGTTALACIVDPVSVDELQPVARLSGLQGMDRECLSHALNTKAIAKRFAKETEKDYAALRLIVAHLGSGISISAHEKGRMIDVTNPRDEGAFSPERAGSVPVMPLVELCFSGQFTQKEIVDKLFKEGGLYSYCGTKDIRQLMALRNENDTLAALVFDAMVYQISKEIGAMASVLSGEVDAILLTGGMAKSAEIVTGIRERTAWIAPVSVFAGEEELQALTEGALRVLRREEPILEYV
ncbi:MAG: butyrate kinase [Calditrichaeota bacterium]|nr:MAG: butyrate kinase [Calditrichota bacterium]